MSSYYGKGTTEGILASLYAQINSITGIGFVDYQRAYNSGITKDKYPGCFINYIRVDKVQVLKDIVKNNPFTVGLVLWVWADEGEDLGTVLNTFIEAVKDKVRTDPNQDNNAYSTNITVIETDSGSKFPQGMAIMMLEIVFFSDE